MPSNAAAESPITLAESPNATAEPSNTTTKSSNTIINAAEYPNDTESEPLCSGEKNYLIVVWWCVFRSWIAVIALFLEFGIEPQW